MNLVLKWFKDHLSDPQIIFFIITATVITAIFITLGKFFTPVIVSLILSYLLEGLVKPLERHKIPRIAAVFIVFCLFLLVLLFLILGLMPLLTKQVSQFIQELPKMITSWQEQLINLPKRYPNLVTEAQINKILDTINTQIGILGQNVLSFSLASVRSLINIIVYAVLVPVMIFFLLKDKEKILQFIKKFLPEKRDMADKIWKEVNEKIAKFIQGKIWEICIVGTFTYIVFMILGIRYALLLSVCVGLSVLVPYVGATAMTIPVALVAYFQWGLTADFAYVLIAYFIIQLLDGNVLVPLLLSGIVNLHPLAIILGILFFGGIWGFWGVFFAIPLATLVHAILKAWPKPQSCLEEDNSQENS